MEMRRAKIGATGPAMELRLLGAALARHPDGAALTGLGAKGMAVLAYLSMQPGRTATRDVLVDLLWSQGSPDQGRASLRQELRRMKRAMGPLFERVIETPGGQIALLPGSVLTDLEQVEAAYASRETAGLSALIDVYGGPLLSPLAVPEAAFQDWVAARNSQIEAAVGDGLLRLMLLDESAGRLDRAAAAARKLLDIDSLQEDVHASLVRIHVAAGRIPQARRAVETCKALFEQEMGGPPEIDLDSLLPPLRPARVSGAAPQGEFAPERAARQPEPDDRPLVALAPCLGQCPESMLAAAAAEAALEQLARVSWMRVRGAAALEASGIKIADLANAADYAVTLRVEMGEETAAEIVAATRMGDAAAVAARRLALAADGELSTAVGLGRALAGAICADLTELETRAALALDDACSASRPWPRLMRARGLVMHGGPRAAEKARALLEPLARTGEADAAELCVLALSNLEECWSGWSDGPREALFRGRELALRALRRAPGDPWPQHVLGIAASLMLDPDSARAHQLRALTIAPGFAPAIGEMARLLALSGDAVEAGDWAARALAAAPGAAEAAAWIRAPALARFAIGDVEGALECTDRALALRPDWAQTRLLKAACLEALGRREEMARALDPVAKILARISPDAVRMAHPFADAERTEALMAPLAFATAETA
ncbi:BTAD domain-containing putative transcriptional regulator [Albimonas sp. CAU 1670]|uniref:BTAD domain-containing putative transcriptional regulator n=1 Tax=Albimonas sp. CAU 1670 TaxID=3032599 RepID=UPI0023DAE5D7|nr:BTAD domain-containing putative transcriptional regulator [Albimonas sp. CAU 1670]MDF2232932.1 BTAD domain-containing putative transcriptional regulator [Albimonas sp. CAU 1670]